MNLDNLLKELLIFKSRNKLLELLEQPEEQQQHQLEQPVEQQHHQLEQPVELQHHQLDQPAEQVQPQLIQPDSTISFQLSLQLMYLKSIMEHLADSQNQIYQLEQLNLIFQTQLLLVSKIIKLLQLIPIEDQSMLMMLL
jgi:hypothetical protein